MKLQDWMKTQGINARKLAARLDCSESAITRWTTGGHPNLIMMSRILRVTEGSVRIEDFVGQDIYQPRNVRAARPGRAISDAQVEDWLRSKGYKAVSILLSQTPGIPFSKGRLQTYVRSSTLKRWQVRLATAGKPSRWVAATALDVSDTYRIFRALRGEASPATLHIEEVAG